MALAAFALARLTEVRESVSAATVRHQPPAARAAAA